ncbi:TsoY family (seleno)protein [Pseudoruegeria sp. SHC-113]|uniref:TsoY family (seleno)protein n=1 Tax=Pseudoruegeria sp. SHC-113 TaxID=2855439 RepID=UPI0021BAC783|nr:hypothetical protein [Pseudoruegeria sp. SHC-113]MCT8159189.1 hypothetical protein [Pseudoruegeria sp. SHC-113]
MRKTSALPQGPAVPPRPSETYAPQYFLASVGAGGLAVTFFMYLMFWIPHVGRPVPVFGDIQAAFLSGTPALQGMILIALFGIAGFAVLNLRALAWNLSRLKPFLSSERGKALRASNAESQLMALPLALAMSVNMLFILGLVFVPGLWGVVEYLFPLAMAGFLAIGVLAFRLLGGFLGRVLVHGGFDCSKNNSFAQILPAFGFAMIGVGMAAPAAMSQLTLTAGLSLIFSTFFLITAALIAGLAMILGLRAMMEHGAAQETAPTLMILIPLMTILAILTLRQGHGLHSLFGGHTAPADTLMSLTRFLSVQILFGLLGLMVLARQGYGARFLWGAEASPGSYALVCPGVAMSVLLQFWINKGLVASGLIAKFGLAYWALSGVAVAFQIAMIALLIGLNRKHFGAQPANPAAPA